MWETRSVVRHAAIGTAGKSRREIFPINLIGISTRVFERKRLGPESHDEQVASTVGNSQYRGRASQSCIRRARTRSIRNFFLIGKADLRSIQLSNEFFFFFSAHKRSQPPAETDYKTIGRWLLSALGNREPDLLLFQA